MDFLDNSSTESLILSGDEYNLEFDSTNFDESQDEEDAISEIVRCVCEMDEENGFMIQVGLFQKHFIRHQEVTIVKKSSNPKNLFFILLRKDQRLLSAEYEISHIHFL